MEASTRVTKVEGRITFRAAMVSGCAREDTLPWSKPPQSGYYTQDAQTYASWGVECKSKLIKGLNFSNSHTYPRRKNGLV